ncbi:MAG TPA: hypothetical protein VND19_18095 [Acetobacteraceae bacterium]|nr:hypothetical protein [Acetobacteraceae bacterium]
MSDAPDIAFRPAQPDPAQDRSGRTVPERIATLLHAVRTLLGYGRHLTDTAQQRAAAPNFASIAVCFGTARLAAILAHLNRGILRALALERVLLARAASGRDVAIVQRRRPDAVPPASVEPQAVPDAGQSVDPAAAPAAHKAAARPSRPAGWNDPELFMPTLEELEADVRRRPIGHTIVAICLDLGVVPGFCTGPFWNTLFEIMRCFGGSLASMLQERSRREAAFGQEQDRRPTSNWHWWDCKRETIRRVLGFFIGEEPIDPFGSSAAAGAPAVAVATGPP